MFTSFVRNLYKFPFSAQCALDQPPDTAFEYYKGGDFGHDIDWLKYIEKTHIQVENANVHIHGVRAYFEWLIFKNCEFFNDKMHVYQRDVGLFEKSKIKNCSFINCTFNHLSTDKQGFDSCNFENTYFKGGWYASRFGQHGHIINCNFDNTNWDKRSVFMREEDIPRDGTGRGRFVKCSFRNADLSNCDFGRVAFDNCSFKHANMENMTIGSIAKCSFTAANVKGMKVDGNVSVFTYALLWFKGADLSNIGTNTYAKNAIIIDKSNRIIKFFKYSVFDTGNSPIGSE